MISREELNFLCGSFMCMRPNVILEFYYFVLRGQNNFIRPMDH